MSCTKCKDGFVASALLGRVACLACRDTRIDTQEIAQPLAPVSAAIPPDIEVVNPLGKHLWSRVYMTRAGFAVWYVEDHGFYSHLLMPIRNGSLSELLGDNSTTLIEQLRIWGWHMNAPIGGYHTDTDVSPEFGDGATTSIDGAWIVRITYLNGTSTVFNLAANCEAGLRFRRAIKLPEPTEYFETT